MGVSYLNCAISGLAIEENELAYIVLLLKSNSEMAKIQKRDWYYAIGLPILGRYDDYGFVDLNKETMHENKVLINEVNKRIKDKKLQIDINDTDSYNSLWSAIIDDRFTKYKTGIHYAFISKKSVDCAIGLFPYNKPISKEKFSKEVTKEIEELKNFLKFMNDPIYSDLNLKIKDPTVIVNSPVLSHLISQREFNWIEKKILLDILFNDFNMDRLYDFYIMTNVLDSMGRAFVTPQYGTQSQKEINKKIKKFYQRISQAKTIKKKPSR